MVCRSDRGVLEKLKNASVAAEGSDSSSEADTPFRVTTGWLVVGEIVVIISTDILEIIRGFLGII